MARFVTGRLLQMVLALLAASLIVFSLVRLSGDPVDLIAPDGATEKDRAEMRASLGLDRSLPAQYLSFIKGFAVGDLGDSIRARVPVTDLIADRVGATFGLAGVAIGVAFLIAVPAGVVAARRRGTLVDTFARGFAVLGQATPPFWLGQVLVVLLAVRLGLFPTSRHEAGDLGPERPGRRLADPSHARADEPGAGVRGEIAGPACEHSEWRPAREAGERKWNPHG